MTDSDEYLRISNEAAELHNLPLIMYDGASATIQITPTDPSIQLGSPLPTYLSGKGLWAGKHGGDYKFFLGDSDNDYIVWDGSFLQIFRYCLESQ